MRNNFLLFFLFFISQSHYSQGIEKLLHVKILANGNNADGIHIVNLVNEKTTISDENGEFYILAKEDDLLVLSALNFEYKRKIITSEDLNSKMVLITMTPKINQIEEVVVTEYKHLNAVDLGILSQSAKKYTPAERRLKTAGDFKPIMLLGLLGGSLPLDPILNAINGRTKRLKAELKVERKELLLARIDDYFSTDFYLKNLKIPEMYLKDFKLFLIDNLEFVDTFNSQNRIKTEVAMVQLSEIYLKKLADEN